MNIYAFTKKELAKVNFRKVYGTNFKKKDGDFSWDIKLGDSNTIKKFSYGINDEGPKGMVGLKYDNPLEIKTIEQLLTTCEEVKQKFIETVKTKGNCWSRWISTEELIEKVNNLK